MTPTPWERVASATYDAFLWLGERRGMRERRKALLAQAHGRVLELGAGTGLNLPHYPRGAAELVFSEPLEPMARRLEQRVRRSGREAEVVRAPAEALPFEDGSFDAVISTLVLCTVEEPQRAIAEARRVLRPGGHLLLIEHLRSESERLARWQDRLNPPWRAFAVGCNCNLETLGLLRAGGFDTAGLEDGEWRGMPPIVRPLAVGAAPLQG